MEISCSYKKITDKKFLEVMIFSDELFNFLLILLKQASVN